MIADQRRFAADKRLGATARQRQESGRRRQLDAFDEGFGENRPANGMLGSNLQSCGEGENLALARSTQ